MIYSVNGLINSRAEVKAILLGLGSLSGRRVAWVRPDLSLLPSSWVTRFIWSICKNIGFFRSFFFQINLQKSRQTLLELHAQIPFHDKELLSLHALAMSNFNTHFPKYKITIPLPRAFDLIREYNRNRKQSRTAGFTELTPDYKRLITVLQRSVETFANDLDYSQNYGYIMKCEVPHKSKIFVRADLHGDLVSLISNLMTAQVEGLLDANYKCVPGAHLVFLGDYIDRGEYDIQVLELLALLRLENPTQVHLLRGNHEDPEINEHFNGPILNIIEDNSQLLLQFYQTLPLTLYMAEKVSGKKYFVHFTHGMFELTVDPLSLLESEEPVAWMNIPIDRQLSERVKNITYDLTMDYHKTIDEREKGQRWELKLKLAARQISKLVVNDERGHLEYTTYNWGDVMPSGSSYLGDLGLRYWKISPADVLHYMRLSSGKFAKVYAMIRGHEHQHEKFRHYMHVDKVIITTLTVGMDSNLPYQQLYRFQPDRAYILTTRPKVWLKQGILRDPRSWKTVVTQKVPITNGVVC